MKIRDLAAVLLLVSVIPAVFVVNGVTVDNRLERWQGSDPTDAAVYEEFRATFGTLISDHVLTSMSLLMMCNFR